MACVNCIKCTCIVFSLGTLLTAVFVVTTVCLALLLHATIHIMYRVSHATNFNRGMHISSATAHGLQHTFALL